MKAEEELLRINGITRKIIGCAIEVHRELGPSLREATYQRAMAIKFGSIGLAYAEQVSLPAVYKEGTIGSYRLDFLVEDSVVLEIKSVGQLDPLFQAQILAYLRIAQKKVGLLINFSAPLLRDGLRRFIL